MSHVPHDCPDCRRDDNRLDRRKFVATAAGAAALGAGSLATAGLAADKPAKKGKKQPQGETLVQQLYGTLTPEQKKLMAFDFDHKLRTEVDNNWRITRASVGQHFDKDQQDLIRQIFMSLHSDEYAKRVYDQVVHDNGRGGFGRCAIAMFGKPGSGKFQFVFTGRHVTRRCDGDSVAGAAFGGPIFYGHAAKGFNEPPDHPGNAYWYQAKRANELFKALDGKQQKLALRTDARDEDATDTVKLSGKTEGLPGVPVSEFSADQKKLARQVMADVLAPFRKEDVAESMKLIEAGGFDNLHFSYYKNLDIGNDGVWDVWQVEGPHMIWYFRGRPHVHTWVNIKAPA